jgi:uncharacterized protein (TIGR02246 family)
MKLFAICLPFSMLLATSALGADAMQKPSSEADAVRAVGQQWRAYYESGNYDAIPDLYTEDTMVMPRGRPRIVGREAMRKSIGGLAAGRRVDIAIEEKELVLAGDLAWYIGDFTVTYTPPDGGAAMREQGRSLVIFKKGDDGKWRVHRDIDSPAPPLGAAAQPAAARAQSTAPVPKVWDEKDRTTATDCDRQSASRYDRTRLAKPIAREDIDVSAAIKQCEADLQRYPGDPRIHFQLGRLYGYAGDPGKTRMHRQAAAAAGNHNAIFLLGYLAMAAAKDDAARCQAGEQMRLAADRGNYSARIAYSAYVLQGRFAACNGVATRAEALEYVKAARPAVDGFFETLLAEHLMTEAAAPR